MTRVVLHCILFTLACSMSCARAETCYVPTEMLALTPGIDAAKAIEAVAHAQNPDYLRANLPAFRSAAETTVTDYLRNAAVSKECLGRNALVESWVMCRDNLEFAQGRLVVLKKFLKCSKKPSNPLDLEMSLLIRAQGDK